MGYADGIEIQVECHPAEKNVTKCNDGKDLHIRCYAQTFRLSGGKPYSGKVEILLKNRWFGIFKYSLKPEYQEKVCKVLGYPGASRIWIFKTKEKQLVTTIKTWSGTDKLMYKTYDGGTTNFAGLTCQKAIRLVNADSQDINRSVHYGIVEIYRNGKWWRLSDSHWSEAEANVVCHYLGYDRASEIYTRTLSKLTETVLSVDFSCHGNEGDLSECIQKEEKTNSTNYAKSSGVRCTVDGEALCKACICETSTVNCNEKKLNWMPWVPSNYTAENVKEYLLGKNNIHNVNKVHLREFAYIQTLDLSSNRISMLSKDLFFYTKYLRVLDLSGNRISTLPRNLFSFAKQLRYLNLSGNQLDSITSEMMNGLTELTVLDISKNKIRHFEEKFLLHLRHLKLLYTDHFTHCCHAKNINPNINCSAPIDVFSSCSELLKNNFLEVFVWIVAILVACGNLGVIIVRFNLDTQGLQTLFIISLVASDILMSVYLFIIGYKNVTYKGRYFEYDEEWRSSKSCTVAGAISLISSQVSLFMITAITAERCWSITYAGTKFKTFGRKSSRAIVIFAWFFGVGIAVFPAILPRYFNSNYRKFYGQNSVCLPLQLPDENKEVLGWEYCLGLFGGVNAILCIYVTICYARMYISLRKNAIRNSTPRKLEDSYLAKRMFGIVMTNLCCWIPVVLFTFLSLGGLTSHVKTIHAWSAVCLFPINAAINPVIYTFFAPKVKEKVRRSLRFKSFQDSHV
ncbi:G-protein coupled receptor GRL101-like [Dendronephthya gigantea]|uniref:G-protein coupled receptor GRL101-like n=1 Tax=Dendronephthya gigantea TaxID=151771 RepID=UPI001069F7DF|nr:G-protein coupled receptor GRL101-like [Dendronephthya gigantea]